MDIGNEITQQHHQALSCSCHPPSPYKINELWSLQKALMYGCNLFIDKSFILSHWSLSLSSSHSSLSYINRMNMIHYATHDVMAVTFLIRPITEKWTFENINNRKMGEMFIAFESTKLPPLSTSTTKKKKIKNINLNKFSKLLAHYETDVESISSDDEIYLNQLMEPNNLKIEQDDIIDNNDGISLLQNSIDIDYIAVINDSEPSEPIQQQELNDKEKLNDKQDLNNEQQLNDIEIIINDENPSKRRNRPHRERTQASRKRRNKKRNETRRLHRYRYYMTQSLYYRYSLRLVRKVLDEYNIDYVHIKEDDGYLVVGLKNKWIKKQYRRQIPEDLFDGRNYRRHYRRHQRQQRTK